MYVGSQNEILIIFNTLQTITPRQATTIFYK